MEPCPQAHNRRNDRDPSGPTQAPSVGITLDVVVPAVFTYRGRGPGLWAGSQREGQAHVGPPAPHHLSRCFCTARPELLPVLHLQPQRRQCTCPTAPTCSGHLGFSFRVLSPLTPHGRALTSTGPSRLG